MSQDEVLKCVICGGSHKPDESCLKQRRWEKRNPERVRAMTRERGRKWRKKGKKGKKETESKQIDS